MSEALATMCDGCEKLSLTYASMGNWSAVKFKRGIELNFCNECTKINIETCKKIEAKPSKKNKAGLK